MVLLDTLTTTNAVNGMNEIVFGLKDLITIGGGIVATVTAYLTLKFGFNAYKEASEKRFKDIETRNKEEKERLVKEYDEKIMNIKHGKNAVKKELDAKIDKLEEMTKLRIDKTQERLESFQRDNQQEFKQINEGLNKILGLLESQKK
jgi:TolA-binding protein